MIADGIARRLTKTLSGVDDSLRRLLRQMRLYNRVRVLLRAQATAFMTDY